MKVIIVDGNKKDLKKVSDIVSKLVPDASIITMDNPLSALDRARKEEMDIAIINTDLPELHGIELGRYLRDLNPFLNVIFLSDKKDYCYEAMEMHASGYLLKPATADKIKSELEQLRYAEHYNDHKRIFAQTFGNFEFFVDGKPVEFKYSKTKEILAVLVNNRGAYTTNGEIIACLWEDDGDPDKKISYLCNLRQDLQNTFTKLGLEGILLKQRGSMAISKDRIECDMFDWLEKKNASKYKYIGDYMNQYSWPEVFHAELDEISYAMEDV